MKQIYFTIFSLFIVNTLLGQTHDHSYGETITNQVSSNFFFDFNDISECQQSASLEVTVTGNFFNSAGGNSLSKFDVLIDGNTVMSGIVLGAANTAGNQSYDLSSSMPFESVRVNQYYGDLGASIVNITYDVELIIESPTASMPTSGPTTSNVNYTQGDTAIPLIATLSGRGSRLKWYTSETGGLPSNTAPTPDTSTIGTTSYWVSQADANDCESVRSEIQVITEILLGINDFDSNKTYSLYPNPSSRFIGISGLTQDISYRIYDSLGRRVKNGTLSPDVTISITNLTNGLYFLQLENRNTLRFIKE